MQFLAGHSALLLFPALVILAAAGDVMTLRIPNAFPVVIAFVFFLCAPLAGMPGVQILLYIACALSVLVAGFLLYAVGLWGGGDAKLLAAAALWVGPPCVGSLVFFTAIAGGVLALGHRLWATVQIEFGMRSQRLGRLVGAFTPNVPYGAAIAAGAIMSLPDSWWHQFTT